MPKFLTYQRPAPADRRKWNDAPAHKPVTPARKVVPASDVPRIEVPTLDELLKKK